MTLRILHLIHNLALGGAETHLRNIMRTPHPDIAVQQVVPWKFPGPLEPLFRADGLQVIQISETPARLPQVWRGLVRTVRQARPDVIHAHMSESAIVAGALNWRFGIPFVQTHHDGTRLVPDMPVAKKYVRTQALRWTSGRASAHIVVVPKLRELVMQQLAVPAARCLYIPNSVLLQTPEALAQADAERRAAAQRGELRVLALGRYVPLKGFHQLIAAAPTLAVLFPGLRIDIFGGGPLGDELRAKVAQSGMDAHVNIAGPTEKPGAELRRAHIYVSTSEYEGTSLALLEAMAWRLPIVVSAVPGNRDVIAHDRTGLHYAYGDVAALADAIGRLAASPETASRLADGALAEAAAQYSAEASLEEHVKLYRRAAGQA